MISWKRLDYISEKIDIIAIAILCVALPMQVSSCNRRVAEAVKQSETQQAVRAQEEYSAWSKLTGNEKNLTLEEWKAAKRAGLIGEQSISDKINVFFGSKK